MLFEAHLLPWPRLRRPSRRRPRKVEKRRDGQPHLGGRDESLPKKLEHRDVHEIFCVLFLWVWTSKWTFRIVGAGEGMIFWLTLRLTGPDNMWEYQISLLWAKSASDHATESICSKYLPTTTPTKPPTQNQQPKLLNNHVAKKKSRFSWSSGLRGSASSMVPRTAIREPAPSQQAVEAHRPMGWSKGVAMVAAIDGLP